MTEQKTPILLSEGDYRLIRFELNREFVITRKSKASFVSRSRVQTLFFTEAMFWHDTSIGEGQRFLRGPRFTPSQSCRAAAIMHRPFAIESFMSCFLAIRSLERSLLQ